jgi:hypothetical protein
MTTHAHLPRQRLNYLAGRLHAPGARPLAEFLSELASGAPPSSSASRAPRSSNTPPSSGRPTRQIAFADDRRRAAAVTALALVAGRPWKEAESRTSKTGNEFGPAVMREGAGEAVSWWSVVAFSDNAGELLRLRDGDAVSVSGPLTVETCVKDGQSWFPHKIVADRIAAPRLSAPQERCMIDADTIVRARNADLLKTAERLHARLKKVGTAEWAGPCPRCGGTDRVTVNTKRQIWHCRRCAKGGDLPSERLGNQFDENLTAQDGDQGCTRVKPSLRSHPAALDSANAQRHRQAQAHERAKAGARAPEP